MTPFHPRLRKALLLYPKTNLTSEKLIEYEGLVTQLYYLENYWDKINPNKTPSEKETILKSLRNQIVEFRKNYMPFFDDVHDTWAENQKKSLKKHSFNINPGKTIIVCIAFLLLWLFAASISKNPGKPIVNDKPNQEMINNK